MKFKVTFLQAEYIVFSCLLFIFSPFINSIEIWKYLLMGTFFWVFLLTLKRRNFSIYQVFLVTYFVFLLSRVFLDILGLYDFRVLTLMEVSYMPDEVALETLKVLTIFLIGSSYAWLIGSYRWNEVTLSFFEKVVKPLPINKMLRLLYFIFIALSFMKMIFYVYVSWKYGYIALFDGTLHNIGYPVIFTGSVTIAEVLFTIMLYYNRDKGSFKLYAGLLLLVGLTKVLTGQRGYGLTFLLYVICMWSTYYKEIRIFNLKILLIALLLPFLIVGIGRVRWAGSNGANMIIDNLLKNNVYITMLYSQGVSIDVISGVIQYQEKFINKVPFMIGYFVDFLKPEPLGQTMKDITDGNYLGDHLPYTLNADKYFSGRGTGTSIVAETYDLASGWHLVFLVFSMLLTLFVLYLASRTFKSVYYFGFSYYFLTRFIYSPRNTLFKNLGELCFMLFFYTVVLQLSKRIGRIKIFTVDKKLL